MSPRPRTIERDVFAQAAMAALETHRITTLFICEGERLVGLVHLHDLLGSKLG